MNPSYLRIYRGPEDKAVAEVTQSEDGTKISIPLGEVLPLLVDAVQSRRTWLRDFESDQITISTDLYEVLLAYQHYRRPA